MICAELFRQGPRPRAMSIVGFTNWFFTMVVALTFELIKVSDVTSSRVIDNTIDVNMIPD